MICCPLCSSMESYYLTPVTEEDDSVECEVLDEDEE